MRFVFDNRVTSEGSWWESTGGIRNFVAPKVGIKSEARVPTINCNSKSSVLVKGR